MEEIRERFGPGEVRLGHLPVGLGHADTVQTHVEGFEFGGGHLLLQCIAMVHCSKYLAGPH